MFNHISFNQAEEKCTNVTASPDKHIYKENNKTIIEIKAIGFNKNEVFLHKIYNILIINGKKIDSDEVFNIIFNINETKSISASMENSLLKIELEPKKETKIPKGLIAC